jgi:hypothetical protein
MARPVLLLFILLSAGLCQTVSPHKTLKSAEDLDAALTNIRQENCQSELQHWKDWGTSMQPTFNAMTAQNARLTNEMRVRVIAISCLGFAIGIAIFCCWIFLRWFRQVRPIPAAKKQLLILLVIACWVSVAVLIALDDNRLSMHPINAAVAILVYSLPPILFGGITVAWIGRTAEGIKFW